MKAKHLVVKKTAPLIKYQYSWILNIHDVILHGNALHPGTSTMRGVIDKWNCASLNGCCRQARKRSRPLESLALVTFVLTTNLHKMDIMQVVNAFFSVSFYRIPTTKCQYWTILKELPSSAKLLLSCCLLHLCLHVYLTLQQRGDMIKKKMEDPNNTTDYGGCVVILIFLQRVVH